MMNMGNNTTPEPTMFDSKFASRVADVEKVLQEMKEKAQQSYKDNDDIMLALYEEVCRVVSPLIGKYTARARREELAALNRNKKALRLANRKTTTKSAPGKTNTTP